MGCSCGIPVICGVTYGCSHPDSFARPCSLTRVIVILPSHAISPNRIFQPSRTCYAPIGHAYSMHERLAPASDRRHPSQRPLLWDLLLIISRTIPREWQVARLCVGACAEAVPGPDASFARPSSVLACSLYLMACRVPAQGAYGRVMRCSSNVCGPQPAVCCLMALPRRTWFTHAFPPRPVAVLPIRTELWRRSSLQRWTLENPGYCSSCCEEKHRANCPTLCLHEMPWRARRIFLGNLHGLRELGAVIQGISSLRGLLCSSAGCFSRFGFFACRRA
ncbi:hypothetical protein FKP32DRAFT_564926 [Trametes sanguinea]|nr:hypothetical protein FKP32DRAFT_564926 [Trametes sanguinea]